MINVEECLRCIRRGKEYEAICILRYFKKRSIDENVLKYKSDYLYSGYFSFPYFCCFTFLSKHIILSNRRKKLIKYCFRKH